MENKFDIKTLKRITLQKLIQHELLPSNADISLTPNYPIVLHGKPYSHYIITCSNYNKKFFLKVCKSGDKTSHCNKYLRRFLDSNGEFVFPIILIPPFGFNDIQYFVTTFSEGENLDTLSKTLTKSEWSLVSNKLCNQLELLSSIQENLYSENNEFLKIGCSEILKGKFKKRFQHIVFQSIPSQKLERAYNYCCEILDNSSFSKPTLIHMDIKPANIIYNPQTQTLNLIDFEHARFGDIDFGWTQILLTKCNAFNSEYKNFLLPNLIKGRTTLNEALSIPKYRTYIFYQTACNLIYYHDRKTDCPPDMCNLFFALLDQFSKE